MSARRIRIEPPRAIAHGRDDGRGILLLGADHLERLASRALDAGDRYVRLGAESAAILAKTIRLHLEEVQ